MSTEAHRIELDVRLARADTTLHLALDSRASSIALVGASGAGKSTCLRILAGFEPRARGRVAIAGETLQRDEANGRRATWVAPWRRGLGWVPQAATLLPHVTVRENLAWSSRVDPHDLASLARRLGLDALLDRRPGTLSGGERQRVALGRALLARPRLLLLDEPLAALDRGLRSDVADVIRSREVPFVLVSHDEHDVSRLCDEVWTLRAQRLERTR